MGTYYINASKDVALSLIKRFAIENDLGEPHIESEDGVFLKVVASKSRWKNTRCIWTYKDDSSGLIITLKVLPPILFAFTFYMTAFYGAVSLLIFGYLLNKWGFGGMELGGIRLAALAFVFLVTAALLFRKIKYCELSTAMLTIERDFYKKLILYSPQVIRSSYSDIMFFGGVVILLVPPIIYLFFGLFKRIPLLTIPLIVWFMTLMVSIWAEKIANRWSYATWRVMLISWISSCTIASCLILLGIVYFTIFSAEMSSVQKSGFSDTSELVKLIGNPIWSTPQELTSQGILAINATIFQQIIERNHFNKDLTILITEIIRLIIFVLVFLLLNYAINGLASWAKTWLLIHPGLVRPSLSPPASLEGSVSRHFIPDLNVLLALLTGGIGNIINLALTIEILSVLFFDHSTFNYSIAQAIGWITIDFKAAANGNVHQNLIGICFLIIIMLPVLATALIWSMVIVYSQVQRLRWLIFPPNNELLSNVANKVALALGSRRPALCVVKQKACFTVKIPLLFGRPCIVINKSFLEKFNSSELEAAIAHELAHIKYDAMAIRLTQWASILTFFPCNAFALLLNMEKREMRADNIASKVINNHDTLMTALVKVCIGQINASKKVASEQTKNNVTLPATLWGRLASYVSLLHPFFWPESILGYAHPAVKNRLMALQTPDFSPNSKNDKLKPFIEELPLFPNQ